MYVNLLVPKSEHHHQYLLQVFVDDLWLYTMINNWLVYLFGKRNPYANRVVEKHQLAYKYIQNHFYNKSPI